MSTAGRPLKYSYCFENLEDDVLYTPAMLAQRAIELGTYSDSEDAKKARIKIRHTFARLAVNHQFPKAGDGLVKLKGQGCNVAFLGQRWKAVLKEKADRKAVAAQVQNSEAA